MNDSKLIGGLAPDWDAGPAIAPTSATKYTAAQIAEMLAHGISLHTSGHIKEAMEVYREVLTHDRKNRKALYFAAIALQQENRPLEDVLKIMEHATRDMQMVPEVHYNLGVIQLRLGKNAEAAACFEKSIKIKETTEALVSLANCRLNEGDAAEGKRLLQRAQVCPATGDSVYFRAFAHLTLGDYLKGWQDFDHRWKTAAFLVENKRVLPGARFWNGKSIQGKTLYVHTEQGAGDVVMASRFLAEVKERSRCRTLVLEVGANLVSMARWFPGVDTVVATNDQEAFKAIGKIDYFIPILSIPRQLGRSMPRLIGQGEGWLDVPNDYVLPGTINPVDAVRHLVEQSGGTSDPASFDAARRLVGGPRIGLSWAGSAAHKNDRWRSIGWKLFRDEIVKRVPGATFYSLQVGDRARDMDDDPSGVVDLTPTLPGYGDTARALRQLDALVAVDTATVHLAASQRRRIPILTLIAAAPDWRWGLEGSPGPWYDDRVELFRASRSQGDDDWLEPLARVRDRLTSIVAIT